MQRRSLRRRGLQHRSLQQRGLQQLQPCVQSFSPQGYVRHVRQVAARFSGPMVALGDPRLADPFTVSCPAHGKGRWADTRDWVFDFDADLDACIRCRFRLLIAVRGARRGMKVRLNGRMLGSAIGGRLWLPQPGSYCLTLEDSRGRQLDRVLFKVRGLPGG